ncbi:MAG: cupin domain-containing protein [Pirellulales bacterium]|nr:cupin domain-containing protein [Pirellulales bacterium]
MNKCSKNCSCGSNDDLRSKVLDPCGLVDYQDGAIVSRTIVEKPSGTLTVFAFDKGQALSEHTAPFDAVVQVLDGKGRFMIAGEASDLSAGQMLIMPADVPHAVTAVEPFKMLLTMIRS